VVVREVRLLESGELDPHGHGRQDHAAHQAVRHRRLGNSLGTVKRPGARAPAHPRGGALLVIDAVHYAPHFPIDVQALGADFLRVGYNSTGARGVLYSRPGALDDLPTDA